MGDIIVVVIVIIWYIQSSPKIKAELCYAMNCQLEARIEIFSTCFVGREDRIEISQMSTYLPKNLVVTHQEGKAN